MSLPKALPPKSPRSSNARKTRAKMDIGVLLEKWAAKTRRADFIPDDPLSFPHRFSDDQVACEVAAVFAAFFAYGARPQIRHCLDGLLMKRMGGDPKGFILQGDDAADKVAMAGFVYRFNRSGDVEFILKRLRWIFQRYGTLENLMKESIYCILGSGNLLDSSFMTESKIYQAILTEFISRFLKEGLPPSQWYQVEKRSMLFLIPRPNKGGACKRLNLLLRWLVRTDSDLADPVDLGLWAQTIAPCHLRMPLDFHVSAVARELGLIQRASDDWKAVEELTNALKEWDAVDPVRFDFALFGLGLSSKLVDND
ncbi:MAG: TIGR02757 family protein [Cyanobacteria bacterium]|nr:TIGR02757 family protein [Cyanobacteriota bacterium]